VLAADRPSHLRDEIAALAARIAPAGATNGLSQLLLRCTAPGVPDLYQGCEFWDLSLVDPDNRRPVDWAARQEVLANAASPDTLMADWQDGRVKQAVLVRALALRASRPAVFAEGDYLPLAAEGPAAAHLMAFARRRRGEMVIAVTTRLPAGLLGEEPLPLVPAAGWSGTDLILPGNGNSGRYRDALTGVWLDGKAGRLPLHVILARLPVALLEVG